jgi:hypothetical protein
VPKWFALLLCGLGAATIAAGLRLSSRGRETGSWTRTTGRILSSRLDQIEGPAEQGWPQYRFEIRYGYEARGEARESEQIFVSSTRLPSSADRDGAQRWVDRFPAGREVDVWFDPADPAEAVLVRGTSRTNVVALVAIGIAFVGIGFLGLARR